MSKHAAYAPKHRVAVERPLVEAPKKALKTTLLLSALAVGGTGAVVGGGLALGGGPAAVTMAQDLGSPVAAISTPEAEAAAIPSRSTTDTPVRETTVSRSESRDRVDPAKAAALDVVTGTAARAVVQTEDMAASGDPKAIASALLGSYGWSGDQFSCLVSLWNRESGWNVHAANPSGAYGIPQALPGSKMSSAGADWRDSAETQITWGLGYIQDRYGSPCGAWGHSESYGWY